MGRNEGIISDCYSTGAVSGGANPYGIGGLVGNNEGNVTNCYSTGAVSGVSDADYIGGLGDITTAISAIVIRRVRSTVLTLSAVWWDLKPAAVLSVVSGTWQILPLSTSAGGTGRTTSQMKTLSTFTSPGWDFVNVWGIYNGQSYPCLKFLTGFNPADLNYSGTVDFDDFAIFADRLALRRLTDENVCLYAGLVSRPKEQDLSACVVYKRRR